jgi:excisionase family DNA binding protein
MNLKVSEAATVLGVSPARVRELIAEGKIQAKHHKTAYYWMIRAVDLKKYISIGPAKRGRPRLVDSLLEKKGKYDR